MATSGIGRPASLASLRTVSTTYCSTRLRGLFTSIIVRPIVIFAIILEARSEMIEPEKPTTIAKMKRVPRLRLEPAMVPKLMPNTICTTVRITESMMKMARLAKMRRPMRLNMAIFFLLGVHPDALKIAAAASSLFSWPQQRDAPRMSEVL